MATNVRFVPFPRAEVFAVLSTPERYAGWAVGAKKTRTVGGPVSRLGRLLETPLRVRNNRALGRLDQQVAEVDAGARP